MTMTTDETASQRVPLTASQHILHLLLTVFTAGLWAPVWIIRAMQGNREYREAATEQFPAGYRNPRAARRAAEMDRFRANYRDFRDTRP